MNSIEAFWLGVVQGLTEFLPVSSSGHLVMLETLLGVEDESGLLFKISVHVATLGAIVLFFRKRIGSLAIGLLRGHGGSWRYVAKLALGTLPAVALVLGARGFLEAQFESPAVAGVCLLVTGLILWTTRHTLPKTRTEEPTWAAAFLIGCAQAAAILPGISRSGATVATALALRIRPFAAAEFSFLLGIVAISGAAVLVLPEASRATSEQWVRLAVGGGSALVSGIAAIWLFLRLLERQSFYRFSYYAWTAGGLFLGWLWMSGRWQAGG